MTDLPETREQVWDRLGPFTNVTDLRNTYADEIIRLRERVADLAQAVSSLEVGRDLHLAGEAKLRERVAALEAERDEARQMMIHEEARADIAEAQLARARSAMEQALNLDPKLDMLRAALSATEKEAP